MSGNGFSTIRATACLDGKLTDIILYAFDQQLVTGRTKSTLPSRIKYVARVDVLESGFDSDAVGADERGSGCGWSLQHAKV